MTPGPEITPFVGQAPLVIARVARAFGLTPKLVRSKDRHRPVVRARQVCVGILSCSAPRRCGAPWTLPEIGRQVGGRDHTTVLHGVRRYRAWCAELGLDPATADPAGRALAIARHLGFAAVDDPVDDEAAPAVAIEPAAPAAAAATAPPAAPAPSPAPIAPVPENPMSDLQRFVPDRIWTGTDFGDFQLTLAEFEALPAPMQAEGLALAIEKEGAETPRAMARVGRRLGLSADRTQALLRFSIMPHELPSESAICARFDERGDAPAAAPGNVERTPSSEDSFRRFAEARLVIDAAGRLDKPAAFFAYLAFCRSRRLDALERANFGYELKRLSGGEKWQGDVQPGLTLRLEAGR